MNNNLTREDIQNIVNSINSYEDIKGRIYPRLISMDYITHFPSNKVGNIVATKINDTDIYLAYRIRWGADANGEYDSTITDRLVKRLNIDLFQLETDAFANAEKDRPLKITALNNMVFSLLGIEDEDDECTCVDEPLIITTKGSTAYGASAIMYNDVATVLSEHFTDGFYLLPSSTDEMLAVPKSLGSLDVYKEMVKQVNANEVAPKDRLSDNVFTFDDGLLVLAS